MKSNLQKNIELTERVQKAFNRFRQLPKEEQDAILSKARETTEELLKGKPEYRHFGCRCAKCMTK